MKLQSFSIISGTPACNASCPYCVSKMTGFAGIEKDPNKVNWSRFEKACRLALMKDVSSILITGKGEPTLYPKQITTYLQKLKPFNFPIIELQTNGLIFDQNYSSFEKYLKDWFSLGLGLISISIVNYDPKKNASIFTKGRKYIDLKRLVKRLHDLGFSVRFSCILIKGGIDNPLEVEKMAQFGQDLRVEQLSLRSVARPEISESKEVYGWIGENMLSWEEIENIRKFLDEKGKRLVTYGHGSILYDLNGQNVCLTNALTIDSESDDIRQLIFFPDGHLRFDWQYKGAIIL